MRCGRVVTICHGGLACEVGREWSIIGEGCLTVVYCYGTTSYMVAFAILVG